MHFFLNQISPANLLSLTKINLIFDFLLTNHIARFRLRGKIELSYWSNFFFNKKGFVKTLRNDVIILFI